MIKFINLVLILAFMTACGKSIENDDSKSPLDRPSDRTGSGSNGRVIVDQPNDLPDEIKLISLKCSDSDDCPSNIVQVAVKGSNELRNCTGSLIEGNKIITAASCLPRSLKVPGRSCSGKIYTVFPGNDFQKEEIVDCDVISYADINYTNDSVLWAQDIAVYKLKKKVSRLPTKVIPLGVDETRKISAWKIRAIKKNYFELSRDNCSVLFNSYANPFSTHRFSASLTATDCEIEETSKGAPLFQDEFLVGIFSEEMQSSLYNYLKRSNLLAEEMGRFYNFSNLACASYFKNGKFFPAQCMVDRTSTSRNILRNRMLRSKNVHQQKMQEVKNEIESLSEYFLWELRFLAKYNSPEFEAHLVKPKCVFNSDSWISRFRRRFNTYINKTTVDIDIPNYVFQTKLDKNLRPKSIVKNEGVKNYSVEFNPHGAHFRQLTYVEITADLHGQTRTNRYENITHECEE
jgi:hypothetical protein